MSYGVNVSRVFSTFFWPCRLVPSVDLYFCGPRANFAWLWLCVVWKLCSLDQWVEKDMRVVCFLGLLSLPLFLLYVVLGTE